MIVICTSYLAASSWIILRRRGNTVAAEPLFAKFTFEEMGRSAWKKIYVAYIRGICTYIYIYIYTHLYLYSPSVFGWSLGLDLDVLFGCLEMKD